MLSADTRELIEVLLSGKVLIGLVLDHGKKGATIKGKGTLKHFTFERMDDGRINFDFGWGTYGRAGYFTDAQLRSMYDRETDHIANDLVMSCFLMKTFDSEEEFEEATDEFEKFLYGFKPSPTAKVKTVEHHEALTFDELREFFAERFDEDLITVSSLAIMFGVLTATRVNEFIGMTWGEVDFKKKVWTIPPSRRKDGKKQTHRVPLSDQAMQILERLDQSTYYVFQSPKGVGHLSKETPRVILRKRFGRGTMHGCRSTFSDWCTETGKDPTLREKSLMHATGNKVTLAYQRSDLLEQRRPLMQAWADALTK